MTRKVVLAVPTLVGGGAQRVIINLAKNLNKDKFDVYLLVLNAEGPYKKIIPDDITLVNLKTNRVRNSFKEIKEALSLINPDVILTTVMHMSLAILAIKNKIPSRPKVIVRLTNTPSQVFDNLPLYKKYVLYGLVKMFYLHADVILAQCKEMKNDFIEVFKYDRQKISYIYNPVDIDYIQQQIKNNPFDKRKINLLAVGSLTYQKGFDTLLKSFKKVLTEIPNAHLTILGEGELKLDLVNFAKKLDILENIEFKGFVNNPYNYYSYSDMYILSSRWEGFPNSLLEALACNTKVVSTDCKSGPREIIDNTYGEIVRTEDVESLFEGIMRTHKNNNRSQNRAQYFNVDKIVVEYEKMLLH